MKKRKPSTIEEQCYVFGILLLICLLFILAVLHVKNITLTHIGRPCLFYLITGYYCPGCGGTRAAEALLCGKLAESVRYHPVVPYAAAVYGIFMISQTIARLSKGRICVGMRFHPWYLWCALIIIIMQCSIKNLLLYWNTAGV